MGKQDNKLVIDLDKWTTQVKKAKSMIGRSGKCVRVEYVSKLIKQGKLDSWKIEALNITLVEK